MGTTENTELRRPSHWWRGAGAAGLILTIATVAAAVVVQREATKPIGEGDVFVGDVATTERLIDPNNLDESVRVVRNELDLEGVSIVDVSGVVIASTSENKVGAALPNDLLRSAVESGRFAAVAAAVGDPVILDGVEAWSRGDVLYQVTAPLTDGDSSMLLYYDVAELLGRRTQPGELQPATLQLAGVGLGLALLTALVFYGRARAARRYEAVEIESNLLRKHSAELEQANEKLDKARMDAEHALDLAEEKIRIRSEFVLMINHELRTPLTSVVTGAELLASADLADEERNGLVESMVSDGNRLLEIIDQILAVARIENRGLAREIANVSLNDLVEKLDAQPLEKSPAISGVNTDLTALSLVVGSLVDNARTHGATDVSVHVSSESRVAPAIQVGALPSPAVHVAVVDNGPGIDEEFLPRIFEKFEKSSFSSGTGLGLYMARVIVEALGGSLSVETSSKGSTFELAIPAVPARVYETVGV